MKNSRTPKSSRVSRVKFALYLRLTWTYMSLLANESSSAVIVAGENIQFYPEGSHLIGVDWNAKLGEYLVKGSRSWQFSHVVIERLIIGDGSSLRDVPTGCVDVVVTTRSLCSVTSMRSTLREICRVLAPVRDHIVNATVKTVNLRRHQFCFRAGRKIHLRGACSGEEGHLHTLAADSADADWHMALFIWRLSLRRRLRYRD